VPETENAGQLDPLGGSCLTLNSTAMATDPAERPRLVPRVDELAQALADLASDPGDRQNRQRAADRALELARALAARSSERDRPSPRPAPRRRWWPGDIMVFAGITPDDADGAVRAGTGELKVPAPAPPARVPFNANRWRPRH
jgi:hypothetical protein